MNKKIAIILGSETDRSTMEVGNKYYEYFDLKYQMLVMSAHRNPKEVHEFASSARENGFGILVGAAGMAAHLAGALKANSILPVIGVPFPGGLSDGMDALLSTVQMPKGVPVATFAIGKSGAINAALCAVQILGTSSEEISAQLSDYKIKMHDEVLSENKSIQ